MAPEQADLYHVQATVWTGEQAEICRAVDPYGKIVALKRLRPDMTGPRAAARALEHEAEVGRLFNHPNVIQVIAFIPEPQPTMVMEYFASRNLKVRVLDPRDDRLLTYHARHIVLQMTEALLHVHQRGIIHMDLKPENYLLSEEGVVKLTDFAIAAEPVEGWRRFFAGRRRIAGTRPYIAPETLRRKAPDFRTDIYSFGATLYEVLAGRPPFISMDRDHLLAMHLRVKPAYLTTYNKMLSSEINEFVLQMLEKDPGRRPQTMIDVKARLEKIKFYLKPPVEPGPEEVKR
ncbi:serine/threonine-protein kinase [Planctomycetota bacterium]